MQLRKLVAPENPPSQGFNVTDSETWASLIPAADIVHNGHRPAVPFNDARLLVQDTTGNVILIGGPTEVFSQEMPAYSPPTPEDNDLLPIDVLYGRYEPQSMAIEIFAKSIENDSRVFGCAPSDLIKIIRMHEYAHAVVRLGVDGRDVERQLREYGLAVKTDWDQFRSKRNHVFRAIDPESHELLAQAITWAALTRIACAADSRRLLDVFAALEAKQPLRYRLSPLVKEWAPHANWTLVLNAARGDIPLYRGETFCLAAGLEALIRYTAESGEFRTEV